MENSFVILVYAIYLPVTILLTTYVARVLFGGGKIFMTDIFNGREDIALATNRMFQVGFYLLNVGFALLVMKTGEHMLTGRGAFELFSIKVGRFSIYLGIMLFFNLYLFFRGKKKSREARQLAEMKTQMMSRPNLEQK